MENDMVMFMGKTIEEITKEELWEALGNASKRIIKLEKEVDEAKLKALKDLR